MTAAEPPTSSTTDPITTRVRDALSFETADCLRRIATGAGIEHPGQRKQSLLDRLAALVGDSESLARFVDRLTLLERAAIADAVYRDGGEHNAREFESRHGGRINWNGQHHRGRCDAALPSPLRVLFCERTEAGDSPLIPESLHGALREHVGTPVDSTLESTEDTPRIWHLAPRSRPWLVGAPVDDTELSTHVVMTEIAALSELPAVLQLVAAGKVSVSEKTRLPSAATQRAIAAVLVDGDFYDVSHETPNDWREVDYDPADVGAMRAFAWPLLLQAGGLAKPFGSKLRLTHAGATALASPPASILRELWSRWLGHGTIDELSRIDAIKGQSGKGKRCLTAPASRRAAIHEALRALPEERWVAVDDLFSFMRAGGGDFEVVHRDPWQLYIGHREYGSLGYDGYHDWDVLQARYALAVLLEYAATLGIIDVALVPPHGARPDNGDVDNYLDAPFLGAYDGLVYLRLNALGASVVGLRDEYAPSAYAGAAVLEVMPSLSVLVAPGATVSAGDRVLLDHIAVADSDGQSWRIEVARLVEAAAQGQSMNDVREFLESRSDQPLPPRVQSMLSDAESRSTALRSEGAATIYVCSEPEVANAICASNAGEPLVLRAGDETIVVAARHDQRFQRLVRNLGYAVTHTGISG